MLPDFVKVRVPVNEAITRLLRRFVRQRPIISSIQSERFFEGHSWGGYGEEVDAARSFRRIETPSEVPTAELIERGPAALLERLPQLANGMADQLEKMMIRRMKEAAEKPDG